MEAFWGTLAGLMVSLIIYIAVGLIMEHLTKRKYKNYLIREFKFNSKLIDKIRDKIRTDMSIISANGPNVFAVYALNIFQGGIINKSFERGYIFDFISDANDMADILEILNTVQAKLQHIDAAIVSYNANPATATQAIGTLSFQERELGRFKQNIDRIVSMLS